jgi:hypothetical protein
MKPVLLISFIISFLYSNSQQLDISLNSGSGKSYIFESFDKNIRVHYSTPVIISPQITWTPKNKTWGIGLRFQNVQSGISGINWMENTYLDGNINSFTTSLLLQKLVQKNKVNLGYTFGIGITKEIMQPVFWGDYKRYLVYPSISLSGIAEYSLSKDWAFQIQPLLFWQDPYNSVRVLSHTKTASLAGEDLSAYLQIGIKYRLFP